MDVTNIPKTFWYSLSIAILASTFVLLLIAYRSSNVSIEIANTKINLTQAISETEELNRQLEQQNEQLRESRAELKRKYDELVASLEDEQVVSKTAVMKLDPRKLEKEKVIIPQKQFDMNQQRLQQLRESLLK